MRRRISIAAAHADTQHTTYTRRVLERYFAPEDIHPEQLSAVEDEGGPWTAYRYPVSDMVHRRLRVFAAGMDISISTLVLRILAAHIPEEVEVLAHAVATPPSRSSSPSPSLSGVPDEPRRV